MFLGIMPRGLHEPPPAREAVASTPGPKKGPIDGCG